VLDNVEHPPLRLGTHRFEPGLHVWRTLDALAHDQLLALLSGADAPRRGRILLDDRPAYFARDVRARIGSLWPVERFTLGRTFRAGLEALPGTTERKSEALEYMGSLATPDFVDRPIQEFTPNDHVNVALALALTTEKPLALVLYEPLRAVPGDRHAMVLDAILSRREAIPVIVLTASESLASSLGGASLDLDAGLLRPVVKMPEAQVHLRIRGVGLRALVAELARNKTVTRLQLESAPDGTEFVSLFTTDARSLSLAVTRIAVDTGLRVLSLESWELPQ
jgi:hypothetical protein